MADHYRPLKDAFGKFATGITVAACETEDGGFRALTVNSFTSVSLSPPLVLWCLEYRAAAYAAFMAADSYAVSILPAGARALSDRFAGREPQPLSEGEYEIWETGAPVLTERLAGFDCRIQKRHKAGDHVILIGEVVRFDSRDGAPLVYFASNYHSGAGSE
ncbi:MAG: flavin reductase family protein [Pseudomonadota bacterium]